MFFNFTKPSLIITAIYVIMFAGIPLTAKDGPVAGRVDSVNKNSKEIIVNVESGKSLKMGERVYVRINGEPLILKVTFPMMTTSKCKPEKKNDKRFSSISKGLTVYMYEKGIEEAETETLDETLYAGNPIVGTWEYRINIYETRDFESGQLTFNANGTYIKTAGGKKETGKFRFDIEKGILEFPGKEGTTMFYAGPLKLSSKEDNTLLFVFRHQQGYSIQYSITHSNTAPFNTAKESE